MLTLGQTIRYYRKHFGFSQKDLAQKIGMDRASLSLLENDKRNLKVEELELISKILQIPNNEILNTKNLGVSVAEKNDQNDITIVIKRNEVEKLKDFLLHIFEIIDISLRR
jgi:transcriptional regulator with XRE-family HTH domain